MDLLNAEFKMSAKKGENRCFKTCFYSEGPSLIVHFPSQVWLCEYACSLPKVHTKNGLRMRAWASVLFTCLRGSSQFHERGNDRLLFPASILPSIS